MTIFVIGVLTNAIASLLFVFLGNMEMAQYFLMWAIMLGIVNLALDK